jgi:hypothetical protein
MSSRSPEGLVNPWGLTFLPNGKMLVTERPGRLRVVSADGKQLSEPVAGLPAVDARGQGGLLDVALDPAFQTNQMIYWSYAEPRDGGANNTAVARGRFVDGAAPKVENVQVIFHQAPSLVVAAALRRPARLRARRQAVRHARRALDHRRAHAGAADGRAARQDRAAQTRRHVRATTRSSARKACGRKSGRSATATCRRRRCNPATASCGKWSTARAAATS